jgi:hypothetical protein
MRQFLKTQHQKCLDILDLIEYAERRLKTLEDDIIKFKDYSWFTEWRKEKIKTLKKIIIRLIRYYQTNVNKLT